MRVWTFHMLDAVIATGTSMGEYVSTYWFMTRVSFFRVSKDRHGETFQLDLT